MERRPDGSFSFSDPIEIGGEGRSFFVFGAAWLMEILELGSGEFFFESDGKDIKPEGKRFGIFYPPFTIVRSCVRDMKGRVNGIGAVGDPPKGMPGSPVIFGTDFEGDLTSAEQAAGILREASNIRSIGFNTKPSLVSIRAKKLIDENYHVYPSIARIADRIDVSHEHLTRQFKRDLGMTPSAYLHQLRTAEATQKLSMGEEIIDISMDVGYNDLSRFYKQFRKNMGTSPGDCREQLKA